jgi:putative RNA 2'-phosphotransferase
MLPKESKKLSKLLSYVLRHHPEEVEISLDENGWVDVHQLIEALQKQGHEVDMQAIDFVVANNEKKRFAFNADKTRLRASQGHSVRVDLDYQPQIPPIVLYHGTVENNLDSILNNGLVKGERHHVHLSVDEETAKAVGQRRGRPLILEIDAKKMHELGYVFYVSANGVWLTENVPSDFIRLKKDKRS